MSEHRPALHPQEHAEKQRLLLLRILRVVFLGAFVVVTALSVLGGGAQGEALNPAWQVVLGCAVGLALVVGLVDFFTPRKKIATLATVFFGLLIALLATVMIGYVLDQLGERWEISPAILGPVKVLLGIALAYIAVVTVLQTQDDFRLVIPYVEFAKQIRGARPMLLDSSALIDARLVEVGETGLIQAPVIIPRFVIAELQLLADASDKLKRARGRRGLDVIARLQRSARLDVSIDERPVPGKAVDQMLIELARTMPAVIVTTDMGLTRVARIQDVSVLNMHDLAGALKPSVIPGEELTLTLIRPGEQPTQGVGYLEDGTMVVAENGAAHLGQSVSLVVTSSLQTSAGKLIFARLRDEATQPGTGHGAPGADASTSDAPPAPEPEEAREPEARRAPMPPRSIKPPSSPRNPRRS
ncbi:MAG: PIN/TRAM domain-containing protein [Phycisphaerales bacterium]|nr:PIN/TRAM domain-containing protein [Phycisphaerales bacterium]